MSQPATNVPESHLESPLVVIPENGGFRVYAAHDPGTIHEVSGDPENPACTCTDFKWRGRTPGYRCPHIQAVFRELDTEQQVSGRQPVPETPAVNGDHSLHFEGVAMLLKRSVSPDGRIDSLSVEFQVCLGRLREAEVEHLALALLDRQDAIAATFMDSRSQPQASAKPTPQNGAGTVTAMLRDVGGMQTRYGWRYFINVEANGRSYKLFGTRRDLSEHLQAAGLGQLANRVSKGFAFNTPCQAILTPSEDGKYMNVESLLPSAASGGNGR